MSLEANLAAPTVYPVWIGFLDFKDDPQYGWSGPGALVPSGTGDSDLDGNTFLSSGSVVTISDIVLDQGLGGQISLTFAAGEITDEDIVQQAVVDRRIFQGRKARIWRGFLQADESAILPEIQPMFTGVMLNVEMDRQPGQAATIVVTCGQDLQGAAFPPVRWIDHQVYYPADTASTFINDLSRGPLAVGTPAVVRGSGGGGSGGSTYSRPRTFKR